MPKFLRYECTRSVQKVSGLTTVHEVYKAYGVLTLSSTYFPSAATHFPQRCCHCWKHFANSSFGMSNSVFVEFRLMSSVASNRCPFRTFLSLGNRKKSHGARSGEYGGCCNWAVPCLAKNCYIRCPLFDGVEIRGFCYTMFSPWVIVLCVTATCSWAKKLGFVQ